MTSHISQVPTKPETQNWRGQPHQEHGVATISAAHNATVKNQRKNMPTTETVSTRTAGEDRCLDRQTSALSSVSRDQTKRAKGVHSFVPSIEESPQVPGDCVQRERCRGPPPPASPARAHVQHAPKYTARHGDSNDHVLHENTRREDLKVP